MNEIVVGYGPTDRVDSGSRSRVRDARPSYEKPVYSFPNVVVLPRMSPGRRFVRVGIHPLESGFLEDCERWLRLRRCLGVVQCAKDITGEIEIASQDYSRISADPVQPIDKPPGFARPVARISFALEMRRNEPNVSRHRESYGQRDPAADSPLPLAGEATEPPSALVERNSCRLLNRESSNNCIAVKRIGVLLSPEEFRFTVIAQSEFDKLHATAMPETQPVRDIGDGVAISCARHSYICFGDQRDIDACLLDQRGDLITGTTSLDVPGTHAKPISN